VVRLLCFPFAGGGGATFRLWPRNLPSSIDVIAVHPPGRAHRLREAPHRRIADMVSSYRQDLDPYLDRPIALFGHSLGAIVAADFARLLTAEGRPPVQLFVSARPRPEPERSIHTLAEPEFITAMNRRYQGIPDEILKHPDVLALLLPALRADVEALEKHEPSPVKLQCPTHVFGGSLDRAVPRSDLEAWRDEIEGPCRIRVFPGDHFYLEPQRENLLAEIAAALAPHASRGAHP
jgi:medium-chain acyl-[acyl-carrier-protein] hydrolase